MRQRTMEPIGQTRSFLSVLPLTPAGRGWSMARVLPPKTPFALVPTAAAALQMLGVRMPVLMVTEPTCPV